MYRIIEPIQITDFYYDLPDYEWSPNDNDNLIQYLNSDPEYHKKVLMQFMKDHTIYIKKMLQIIPINVILELYQDYNFLANYISQELYSHLIKKSHERMLIHLYHNTNYKQELINLNNQINTLYNFSEHHMNKYLDQIKKDLPQFDFTKFCFGSETLLTIAQKEKPKVIKLYSFEKHIKIPKEYETFIDIQNQIILKHLNYTIIVDSYYYQNLGEVLLDRDMIICDHENHIYANISGYQILDHSYYQTTLFYRLQKKDITSFKLMKYEYNKPIFNWCYVCRKPIQLTYPDYQDMCLFCGEENYKHKIKTANLSTCNAFITGIRQKIGLHIALKILRCGGKVIGTTRYPHACLYNYMQQIDYNKWKDNLTIYQCDFTNLSSVMKLIEFIKEKRINIFINNACQTIRASNKYYEQINLLEHSIQQDVRLMLPSSEYHELITYSTLSNQKLVFSGVPKLSLQLSNFQFNQFFDIKDDNIRRESSWMKNIEQIDPGEILEAIIINQTVPTLLISAIKNTMVKPRFIIQVTALEGQFSASKTSNHPHTNMCKAAMNMLIKTISDEKEKNQYVFSINPGFISGINPQYDHYPLSPEDGASRILYPIIEYYNGTPLSKDWVHLRNYKPETW